MSVEYIYFILRLYWSNIMILLKRNDIKQLKGKIQCEESGSC